MHPTVARSNRSSLQTSIPSVSTPSALLHQYPPQQHHQHILYGPIANPVVSLQPCGTGVHPSCVYPGGQRNAGLPAPIPLHMQGRGSRWPTKNKVLRSQQQQYGQAQQHQQQHVQQQLPYSSKPLILFDQTSSNVPPPPSTTSFLVASSTFTHGSFTGDQYNNSGVTLVPQTYFKPPDVQAFCFVQDRQSNQPQDQPPNESYYNISATNTCSLQSVNSNSTFQFANLGPYAAVTTFTNNQVGVPAQTVQSTQIYPSSPVNLVFGGLQREKPSSLSALDAPNFKCSRNKSPFLNTSQFAPIVRSESYNDWPNEVITTSSNNIFDGKSRTENITSDNTNVSLEKTTSGEITKTQEEQYSDESSASFDFTIEAEKMVSALCNTSSNDLGKEETRNDKTESMPLFSGAGDTASNKSTWFTDLCTNYGNCRSIAVQTDGPSVGRTQCPELIRKAVYWGCTEAEIILNNPSKTDPKYSWLRNISCATRTAITKSSTCFPIFAGDRVFIGDLINALLRISNGWLILDNYLNKQHYPSLNTKLDRELVKCFEMWEENTYELLNQIVQTFLKLDENNENVAAEQGTSDSVRTSFPGDISLYTNYDLFEPSSNINVLRQQSTNNNNNLKSTLNVTQSPSVPLNASNVQNFQYYDADQQAQQQCSQKEGKSRSKWTIVENVTSGLDSVKFMPDMFSGHSDASCKFRTRTTSSSSNRIDSSTQSLNAEFFHLKNKVLDSNHDPLRQRMTKDKRQEFVDNTISTSCDNVEGIFRGQPSMTDANCENTYAQKCSSLPANFLDPATVSFESVFFTSNTNATLADEYNYTTYSPFTMIDHNVKGFPNFEQNYGSKVSNVDSVYVGKPSTNQLELAAVPKNKMTLLSQIEPTIPEKASGEMTANLSAWFASMRNSNGHRQIPITTLPETQTNENVLPRFPLRQDVSKNTMELMRQLQIDTNRQLQTLQNMQSIQSAPWNACNLIHNRTQVHQIPDEYDSSEDVRVYMKPGSYNVPKKRHQRRSNRRLDNSSMQRNVIVGHRNHYSNKEKGFCVPASSTHVLQNTVTSVSVTVSTDTTTTLKSSLPTNPIFSHGESSSRILKRVDSTAQKVSQDVTWKAACASAEILLEALNVKVDVATESSKELDPSVSNAESIAVQDDIRDENELQETQRQEKESFSNTLKQCDDNCAGASSYEASEDDSGSTCQLSPNTSLVEVSRSPESKNGFSRANVKTDSWLIRTLNNAGAISKQKRRKKNTGRKSSESTNSSVIEDTQAIRVASLTTVDAATTIATTTTIEKFEQTTCAQENISAISLNNDTSLPETSDRVSGKATYSETVRRYASMNTSYSGKKETSRKSKLNIASSSTTCSTVIPIPGRKCQRKDTERSYFLLHKSRKSSGKKSSKACETNCDTLIDEGSYGKSKNSRKETAKGSPISSGVTIKSSGPLKSHGKKKDNTATFAESMDGKPGKSTDRGWSVWYSSKRKQGLSPLAVSKLETIHQMVCQMEEAKIFKYPTAPNTTNEQPSSTYTIEDYCKVIKSPVFLETIGYKLKNRVYHKVEHVIRDFRRIIYNSKLYHKDDDDRVKIIESLSKKLEALFEEHFASWDFGNISGSPREGSPTSYRVKVMTQKSIAGRYGITKKSSSSTAVTENVSFH